MHDSRRKARFVVVCQCGWSCRRLAPAAAGACPPGCTQLTSVAFHFFFCFCCAQGGSKGPLDWGDKGHPLTTIEVPPPLVLHPGLGSTGDCAPVLNSWSFGHFSIRLQSSVTGFSSCAFARSSSTSAGAHSISAILRRRFCSACPRAPSLACANGLARSPFSSTTSSGFPRSSSILCWYVPMPSSAWCWDPTPPHSPCGRDPREMW